MDHLEQFRIGPTPSVYYVPNYLSQSEQDRLLTKINGSNQWTTLSARRLQQHGGQPDAKGMLATPLPDWLAELCKTLFEEKHVPQLPNHVLINEYASGQGIAAHEDGPLYTPHFAIISLRSSLVLHFLSKRTDDTPPRRLFSLLLEPGSLLIVSGEGNHPFEAGVSERFLAVKNLILRKAYTHLLHGIDAAEEDVIDEMVVNAPVHLRGTLKRDTRVSLTIRHVVKVKDASKLFRLGGK